MIRNIVIEGIDCAGKSTLAKELKTELGWDMRFLGHKGSPSQFLRYLKEYAELEETVIERSHISEHVYASLFGRPSPFSETQAKILDDVLNETTLLIACIPPLDLAETRYRERTNVQQIIKLEQFAAGHALFKNYFDAHKNVTNILRYGSKDFAELDSLVKKVSLLIHP